jgi:hypothetical protein
MVATCRSNLMQRGACTFLPRWKGRVRSWPSFRLAPDRTDRRSRSMSSSRVRTPGNHDRHWSACGHRRTLTVILLGFKNDRAGRMAPFAHARRITGPNWCGELPGVRASVAAAVRCRGKASGRRVVRWVPTGALRRFLLCAPGLPPRRVRGHVPPGARRATRALEDVKKVLTDRTTSVCAGPLEPAHFGSA